MGLRVGMAMSGGVDSSVGAALLLEAGHAVTGFHMDLPLPDRERRQAQARAVADRLGVELRVLAVAEAFSREVVGYFLDQYRAGRTPNPCVRCNEVIKFGVLLDTVLDAGMDRLATGHYARLGRDAGGAVTPRRGGDPAKDQSYFLCRLGAATLKKVLFPLGDLVKEEVRARAARLGLDGLHGSESQDVCFLARGSLVDFLRNHGQVDAPGELVDREGRVLGRYDSVLHFTVGQRRGIGLADATPWYVAGLDVARNRVVVAKRAELAQRGMALAQVRWTGKAPNSPWRGAVAIRSRHWPAAAVVTLEGAGRAGVRFDEPQWGVSPGQFAVFYSGDLVVGSGEIVGPGPGDGRAS